MEIKSELQAKIQNLNRTQVSFMQLYPLIIAVMRILFILLQPQMAGKWKKSGI